MSGSILRAIRTARKDLRKYLDDKPDQKSDFASEQEKLNYVDSIETYLDLIKGKRSNLNELNNTLMAFDTDGDKTEQDAVEKQIEETVDMIIKVDEVIVQVNRISLRAKSGSKTNVKSSVIANSSNKNVKLPKLQLVKFDGNMLKWQEFWDSFDSSVNQNEALTDVDRTNYLKAQVVGDAKLAISGLTSTADNYPVAVKVLKERFGQSQMIIDSHYISLADIKQAVNQTKKIRYVADVIEQHLNYLEALGEDVNHRHLIALIKSKLPPVVVVRLEEQRNDDDWDTTTWRQKI
jgi:hypothetical protein